MSDDEKLCKKCLKNLQIENFENGRNVCKICRKKQQAIQQKEYYKLNKKEFLLRSKKWVLKNKEKVLKIKANYRNKNRQKFHSKSNTIRMLEVCKV